MVSEIEEIAELRRQVDDLRQLVGSALPRKTAWTPAGTFIGEGCIVAPTVHFMSSPEKPISIGTRTNIYRGTEITGPVTIGSGCLINRDGYIRSNTTIGDRVMIGPFTRFVTDTHELGPAAKRGGKNLWPPIVVGDGTWIGASVTVLGGVTIGAGCVVAAGAVVVSDVPDNALVGGVPARLIKMLHT